MGIVTAPFRQSRASYLPKFRPRSFKSLGDTGIDTNEELDDSETDITMDADASSAMPAGSVIRIEDEFMLVVSVATVTVTVARGHASSTAATHTTNQDVLIVNTVNTVLSLSGQKDPFGSQWTDESGNGNHGTLSGAVWAKNAKGLPVVSFDRADDWVVVPSGASVTGQTQVFFSIWFNATVLDATPQQIFHEPIAAGVAQARFELNIAMDNKLNFAGRAPDTDGLTTWINSSAILTAGKWHHTLSVFDSVSDDHFLYVDGVSQTANVAAAAFTPADALSIRLGARSDGGVDLGGFLALPILEFRLPTTSEVSGGTSFYNSQRGLFGV